MKILLFLFLLSFSDFKSQHMDLHQIRQLYSRAPKFKRDGLQLNQLMLQVDKNTATPVLICYKGANEMIQAKYSLNPITKLEKFNRGKLLVKEAIARDKLNLEMRFIRYSIQQNSPAFLGYRNELEEDKQFLLNNINHSNDPELQEIIRNYLSAIKD